VSAEMFNLENSVALGRCFLGRCWFGNVGTAAFDLSQVNNR